jgi:methylmalonyl-CoA/ethylmalonyl-CoA epimerase
MIRKVDHVGIAVRSLKERMPFWAEALGMDVGGLEEVASEKVRVALLPTGESRIELLEPTSADSPIAKAIEKRGEGIHHLTLEVDDIRAVLERVTKAGVRVLGEAPRTGAGGSRVAFLHPKSCGGVLVELVEHPRSPAAREDKTIGPGQTVLLYLREPQEKLWGVLRQVDSSGIQFEGIDLASFDDWVAQIERGEESVVGPSVLYLPMLRIERILLDRPSGHLPSLAERFQRRTGRSLTEVLAEDGASSGGGTA